MGRDALRDSALTTTAPKATNGVQKPNWVTCALGRKAVRMSMKDNAKPHDAIFDLNDLDKPIGWL
jgi:hypothetical protein